MSVFGMLLIGLVALTGAWLIVWLVFRWLGNRDEEERC